MTKLIYNIEDSDGNIIKELTGMIFPMGFFLGHDEKGRLFYGKTNPLKTEILEIYQYKED